MQVFSKRDMQPDAECPVEKRLSKIEVSCADLSCRFGDAERKWAAASDVVLTELASLRCHVEAVNCKSIERLGIVEQQLAVLDSRPCHKTADAEDISEIPLPESTQGKRKELEYQVDAASKERIQEIQSLATATTTPANSLLLELLKTRMDVMEQQLADRGRPSQIIDSVSDMTSQFRAELTLVTKDIIAELRAELQTNMATRSAAMEKNAISSVNESVGAKLQPVLNEVLVQVKKLQTAQAEAENMAAHVQQMQRELRSTTHLVTSLANRALHEENVASSNACFTRVKEGGHKVKSEMMDVIGTAIHDAFKNSPSNHPGRRHIRTASAIDDDSMRSAVSTTDTASDVTEAHEAVQKDSSTHEGISQAHAMFLEENALPSETKDLKPRLMGEDLFKSLQGLANTIDKTINRQRSTSPVGTTATSPCRRATSRDLATPPLSARAAPTSAAEILIDGSLRLGSQKISKIASQQAHNSCGTQEPSPRRLDTVRVAQLKPQPTGQRQLSFPLTITRMEAKSHMGNTPEVYCPSSQGHSLHLPVQRRLPS